MGNAPVEGYEMSRSPRHGMTLIELLIVISIVTLLVQLALPAVQMARERARVAQCANNLRQIALAAQNHESAVHSLPTGGWGWAWVGDPDRGAGEGQPGSWAYQLLPYLEAQAVHDIGAGARGSDKHRALAELASTPVPLFYCPSRRLPRAYPNAVIKKNLPLLEQSDLFWYNALRPEKLARSDYAANVGDMWIHWGAGPPPEEADSGRGFFDIKGFKGKKAVMAAMTGVVFQRQPIEYRQITDGLSQTYFAGEKPIVFRHYVTGQVKNDDQSCWNGDALDVMASTQWRPVRDMPVAKWRKNHRGEVPFGSPHIGQLNMALCDGSVRLIDYSIDRKVHAAFGNRHDGGQADGADD